MQDLHDSLAEGHLQQGACGKVLFKSGGHSAQKGLGLMPILGRKEDLDVFGYSMCVDQ